MKAALLVATAIVLSSTAAQAHHAHRHLHHSHRHHAHRHSHHHYTDGRPSAWCGWQMRMWLGVKDASYNLARNWAHFGTNAGGPCVGCIVVWPHHVGRIVGRGSRGWIVESGNDGNAIRRRERSVAGAIAFRRA